MTNNELKAKFGEYMAIAIASKDPVKMRVLEDSFSRLFNKVADVHPEMAAAALEVLTAIEYYNYVTAEEATKIAASFVNDDKGFTGASDYSHGAHWKMEDMKGYLSSHNLPLEEKPYYNWPALWLTVNMVYSDFAENIMEMTGTRDGEKMAMSAYHMAVKKLKDLDRQHFIREYFHL